VDGLSILNSFNHTLRILIFLKEQPEAVNQTQVRDGVDVQNPQTISNSLGALEDLGLISTRVEVPRTRWITLTEKGRRVAEHAEAISEELSG
jgi:DNA-binding PadR family transcriptional regulator